MVEEVGVLLLLAGDAGAAAALEEATHVLRPCGGAGRSDGGGGGDTIRSSICAASFSSVAFRSATRSAMRASRSLSSSS